jgi:predicted RNA binding protein YcfA (HicA-like mRNA interferase family)
MPRLPRLTAAESEGLLLKAGFVWLRTKGSHRIYAKGSRRVIVPFHGNATLHPKTVKEVFEAIEEASITPLRPE